MMRLLLLASSLLSCSLLVGKINPCFNGKNEGDSFCFEQKKSIQLPGQVSEIKSGDIDGDGTLDLVMIAVGSQGFSTIHVLFHDGAGNFEREEVIGLSAVVSFDVADSQQIPGSRKDDIIAVNGGSFSLIRESAGLLLVTSQLFATLNIPGTINATVCSFGQFNPDTATLEASVAIEVVDPAQDPVRRGVVHNFSTAGGVLGGSEFNTDLVGISIPDVGAAVDFQAHNLGDDQDDEFVVLINDINTDSRALVLYQNNAPFPDPLVFGLARVFSHITLANLDADPQLEAFFQGELVNGTPTAVLAQINVDSQSAPTGVSFGVPIPLLAEYQTSTSGDVDGDDLIDLLVANSQDQVQIVRQQTDGSFITSDSVLNLSPSDAARFAMFSFDANNDGVDDIFVSDSIDQVEVFFSVP